MGYRSLNEVMNLLDQRDVKGAKACFHDEFMHLREAEMLTIEEMYKHLDEFASGKCTSTNRVTHHDDEHSGTYSHVVTYNETWKDCTVSISGAKSEKISNCFTKI